VARETWYQVKKTHQRLHSPFLILLTSHSILNATSAVPIERGSLANRTNVVLMYAKNATDCTNPDRPSNITRNAIQTATRSHLKQGSGPDESIELLPPRSLHPYACQNCHKMYKNSSGLQYHLEHHPDCKKEPPKHDIRTGPLRDNSLGRSSAMSESFESAPVAAPVAKMRSFWHGDQVD